MIPVKKAVFPVAGLGTRFRPVTAAVPKEMLPVVDKPLIDYAIEEAVDAGISDLIFVVSKDKEIIVKYLSDKANLSAILRGKTAFGGAQTRNKTGSACLNIEFVFQEKPLGLGHAILCAQQAVGEAPFAVVLPDDLILSEVSCLAQMLDEYKKVGGNFLAVVEVEPQQTNMYGILEVEKFRDGVLKVTRMFEKPSPDKAPSNFAIVGRYVLDASIFEILRQQSAGTAGEIQLTEAMDRLLDRQDFHGFQFYGTRYDCGDKVGLLEANIAFFLHRKDLNARAQKAVDTFVVRNPKNGDEK